MAKPIIFSAHSELRLADRGATKEEVVESILSGEIASAKREKMSATKTFDHDERKLIRGKSYRFKTLEVVFADEPEAITVVTILVYYHNSQ